MRRAILVALAVPLALAGAAGMGDSASTGTSAFAASDEAGADRFREQLVRERAQHDRVVERLRAALAGARSKPAYVWWSTGDTRAAVEAVFDERQVPEGGRVRWRCIFSRESGWRHDVWYGGARGWRPEYAGSDRVNGVAQLRPFWAWWWKAGADGPAPRHDASLETYRITSDPVTSTRIALRIGFGPFFAQDGAC